VAGQLPAQLGAPLLEAARQAFTDGLQVVFAVSAAIAVAIVILVAALLRGVDAGSRPEAPPAPCPDGPCAGKVGVVKLPEHSADARAGS
jgi:DHA2 family multidrug resistance protein-like MFS transporter